MYLPSMELVPAQAMPALPTPDPITERLALADHIIEPPLICLDHNSSNRIAIQANRFPGIGRGTRDHGSA